MKEKVGHCYWCYWATKESFVAWNIVGASDNFACLYFRGDLLDHTNLRAVIQNYPQNQQDFPMLSDGWVSVLVFLEDYELKLFNADYSLFTQGWF